MTIEIKVLTSKKCLPSWLKSVAKFMEGLSDPRTTVELYIKVEPKDC